MSFLFPEQMFRFGESRFWLPLCVVVAGASTSETLYSVLDGRPWPLDRFNCTSWSFYLENGVFAPPFRIGPAFLTGVGILPLAWEVYTFLRLALSPYSYLRAFFAVGYAHLAVMAACEFIIDRRGSTQAAEFGICLGIIGIAHLCTWLHLSRTRPA